MFFFSGSVFILVASHVVMVVVDIDIGMVGHIVLGNPDPACGHLAFCAHILYSTAWWAACLAEFSMHAMLAN